MSDEIVEQFDEDELSEYEKQQLRENPQKK